jgi:hypothetical protein
MNTSLLSRQGGNTPLPSEECSNIHMSPRGSRPMRTCGSQRHGALIGWCIGRARMVIIQYLCVHLCTCMRDPRHEHGHRHLPTHTPCTMHHTPHTTHIPRHTPIHPHAPTHTHTQTLTVTQTHTVTHTDTHRHTHHHPSWVQGTPEQATHTHIHTHTHTHTHTRQNPCVSIFRFKLQCSVFGGGFLRQPGPHPLPCFSAGSPAAIGNRRRNRSRSRTWSLDEAPCCFHTHI